MDYSKFILLGLIAIAGTGNAFTISQNRTDGKQKIKGGELISIDKAPYQVYLKESGQYICGGALIRPNIVLTAAHCVEELFTQLFVVAGTDSTKLENNEAKVKGSITIRVEQYKIHPKYDPESEETDLKYDFAIIKLERDFPETKKISPIELTTVSVKEGDELLLTGIGRVDENSIHLISPVLKTYKPKVINCKDALLSLKLPILNYDGLICHKSPLGYTTLVGDSGSPIVNLEGKLVGIHTGSFGGDLCESGINVFYYLDWIEQMISLYTNEVTYD